MITIFIQEVFITHYQERDFIMTVSQPLVFRVLQLSIPLVLLGLSLVSPVSHACDSAGRLDNRGNYIDSVNGHSAACSRYESGTVAPATIGGLVNGLEMEQRAKAQLAGTMPGQQKTATQQSVITIEPNVIPTQNTTRWMIHNHNGHMMIGGGQ